MLATHIKMSTWVLAVSLPSSSLVMCLGTLAEVGPNLWTPITHRGDPDGVPGSTAWEINQCIEDFLSFSLILPFKETKKNSNIVQTTIRYLVGFMNIVQELWKTSSIFNLFHEFLPAPCINRSPEDTTELLMLTGITGIQLSEAAMVYILSLGG